MSGAIRRALEMQRAAAAEGFDWNEESGLWDKLAEEIGELRAATDRASRKEELGDLLFMVVNLARHLQVDPDQALAAANLKFDRRFNYILDRADGLPALGNVDRLAAMEALWQEAKRVERKGGD